MMQDRDKQIKDLGIDTDVVYEVGGSLDNLETLFYYLSNEIEYIQRGLEKLPQENWLKSQIKHLMQLTFVISNEYNNCAKYLEKLRLQLEGE